ncbi:MAG: phosphotransferase family protein [Bacillota bacterium]
MDSGIKWKLTDSELSAITERTFGQTASAVKELTDGWANSAYDVTLEDGRSFIVKAAPLSNTKMMTYEQGLMNTEVEVLRLVRQDGFVPVPLVYAHDASESLVKCEYFIMEKLEGDPYVKVKDSLSEEQRARIEHQLGVYNRRINEIRGERFGIYAPSGEAGPSWKDTFHRMLLSVLSDGESAGVQLTAEYETIRNEISLRLDSLDEVTEPRLVHWDLWDGNVFVKDGAITGIIDFERTLWGDPLMEMYFSHFINSQQFLEGYGIEELTPAQRSRRALYDLYLDLILYIECPYRFYTDKNHIQWARENAEQGWARFLAYQG